MAEVEFVPEELPTKQVAGAGKIPAAEGLISVEQQRVVAEVQGAMIIAKKFPRSPQVALDRILLACGRQGLAEQACYEYTRGGTEVSGPSIRLAEAIAQNWGNIQFGVRELEQRNGASIVEAFAWDVETGARCVKQFEVPHIRYTKQGSYGLKDPRDIYEMVANQGARRLRSCILAVIPADIVEAAVHQAEETLRTKVPVTKERIEQLIGKFAEFQVTREMLETRIQRRIDSLTPGLMLQLARIYTSLKDGMSKPEDWFPRKVEGKQHGPPATLGEALDRTASASPREERSILGLSHAAWEALSEEQRSEGGHVTQRQLADLNTMGISDEAAWKKAQAMFPALCRGRSSLWTLKGSHVDAVIAKLSQAEGSSA